MSYSTNWFWHKQEMRRKEKEHLIEFSVCIQFLNSVLVHLLESVY